MIRFVGIGPTPFRPPSFLKVLYRKVEDLLAFSSEREAPTGLERGYGLDWEAPTAPE